MWAITSYFNPIRYKRRLSNYRIFRSNLHIPLVTVELSFDGQFELTKNDADVLIQISGGAVLWQKERLLNIALKSVPSDVKNIIWLDCDILFKRNDWVEEAERQLNERYNIIQLFSKAIYLNKEDTGAPLVHNYNSYRTIPGLLAVNNKTDMSILNKFPVLTDGAIIYNPGLAWAAKKEIFATHGFYDLAIVGAGDLYMASSIFGKMNSLIEYHAVNRPRSDSYLKWARPFHRTVANKVGYISGEIYHLWHGDTKNRNYKDRFKILANFNPQADVYIGDNGVWHWTKPNTTLAEQLRAHFLNRREDG
jgi:predicted glycosyltransferase involved in capsule biosynthesis